VICLVLGAFSIWRALRGHDWDDDPLAEPLGTMESFGLPFH
jgi:hypothetical protein